MTISSHRLLSVACLVFAHLLLPGSQANSQIPSLHDTLAGYVLSPEGIAFPHLQVRVGLPGHHRATPGDSCSPAFFPLTVPVDSLTGRYQVAIPRGCKRLVVAPFTQENALPKYTVRDLLVLVEHIMGVRPLQSAHQLIMADLNNSHMISAYDLRLIRNRVLGLPDTTRSGAVAAWAFIPAGTQLDDAQNPFSHTLDNFLEYEQASGQDPQALNFTALRKGDFTQSLPARLLPADSGIVSLSWPLSTAAAGDIITLPIRLQGPHALKAFQIGLRYEGKKLAFLGPSKGTLTSLNTHNFHIPNPATQAIKVVWVNALHTEDEELPPGATLFHLTFRVLAPLTATDSLLHLDDSVLPALACLSDTVVAPFVAAPSVASERESATGLQTLLPGWQVTCTPADEQSELRFNISTTPGGKARLWLLDAFGNRLITKELMLSAQETRHIALPEWASYQPGIYHWKLAQTGKRIEGRVVKTK